MKKGDPLKGPETIIRALSYVFPSLMNDTHIMRPLNEITRTLTTFWLNYLSWAYGQSVKVQALESIRDLSKHRSSSRLYLGHKCLMYFGCTNGFLGLCHTFFGWDFILGRGTYQQSLLLGKQAGYFEHFVFMCGLSTFLFHTDNTSSFFFLVFLASFDGRIMQVCGDIMGLGSWESFQGPLMGC
jgi:hypothetical protein